MKKHTCNTYIVKSNLGSKESWVIQSNYDVLVCGCMVDIYGGQPNSTMLLENISLFWNLETTLQENMGYFIHLFLFFRGASEYLLYSISRTLVHFFISFFMNNFCIAPYLFFATKLLRDSNKNLEHLFGEKTIKHIFGVHS